MHTIRELEQQEKYKNMLKRKNKEIERLKSQLDFIEEQNKYIDKLEKLLQQKENIIKEAIDFIYNNAFNLERNYQVDDLWYEIPELLNILDKGE